MMGFFAHLCILIQDAQQQGNDSNSCLAPYEAIDRGPMRVFRHTIYYTRVHCK